MLTGYRYPVPLSTDKLYVLFAGDSSLNKVKTIWRQLILRIPLRHCTILKRHIPRQNQFKVLECYDMCVPNAKFGFGLTYPNDNN